MTAASLGAPLVAWWYARRCNEKLRCAIVMATATLFSPICWGSYLPVCVPAIILGVQQMLAAPVLIDHKNLHQPKVEINM
jgi:hypothetical protein